MLDHCKREESSRLSRYNLATPQSPYPPGLQALGWRRAGTNRRAGQIASVGSIPKHIGVRRFEELDVVLHASIGALGLLQPVFQVLQSTLVTAVRIITASTQLVEFSFGPAQLSLKV